MALEGLAQGEKFGISRITKGFCFISDLMLLLPVLTTLSNLCEVLICLVSDRWLDGRRNSSKDIVVPHGSNIVVRVLDYGLGEPGSNPYSALEVCSHSLILIHFTGLL